MVTLMPNSAVSQVLFLRAIL